MTANGRIRPIGPLASTAKPALAPLAADQARSLVTLCQNKRRVKSENVFSNASGLAKCAEAQKRPVLARIKPASSPVAEPNMRRPSS